MIEPDVFTDAVKSFISSEFLTNSYESRKEWIESHLRKYYDSEDIGVDNFTSFNTKDAVVWIDPLDGTNDFVRGNLSSVTVLIGLAINERSRLGIIHNPFNEDDNSLGRTMFGCAEHGVFEVKYNQNQDIDAQLQRRIKYLEPFQNT